MSFTRGNKSCVSFWGTRGTIPTPGRMVEKYGGNTSCVSLSTGSDIIIFDAGTGIRNLGAEIADELTTSKPVTISIFLSHLHLDHLQGLPFFEPLYIADVKINIYVSYYKERTLRRLFTEGAEDEYSPISMSGLNADINICELDSAVMQVGNALVSWQEQRQHPGGSVRYKVQMDGRTFVYATDIELDEIVAKGNSESEFERYSDFIKGADLLVGDGQYSSETYLKHKGFGHSSIPVLIKAACKAKVKRLAVFHHEPSNTDNMLDEFYSIYAQKSLLRATGTEVFWAREGLTVAL